MGPVSRGFSAGPDGGGKDRTDRASGWHRHRYRCRHRATGPADRQVPDHAASVRLLIDQLAQSGKGLSVQAIGHRVVHGGSRYADPAGGLAAECMEELRRLSPYDPEHLPAEITLIEAFGTQYPQCAASRLLRYGIPSTSAAGARGSWPSPADMKNWGSGVTGFMVCPMPI